VSIVDLVDKINDSNIIYENENLSLPLLDILDGSLVIIFFTYSISINGKSYEIGHHFERKFIYDGKGIIVNYDGINISNNHMDRIITTSDIAKCNVDYNELLVLTQRMFDSEFDYSVVYEYASKMNSYVEKDLIDMYFSVGSQFIEYVNDILRQYKENH
jgi:hypothetical protein